MKNKKLTLLHSVIAMLLCVSMLVGTTFAWFTDSVTTGINTIAAGTLDVEMYHSNAAVQNEKVNADTKLFMDLQGNSILWEPGVVSYENLRIVNEGDLALAYQLAINTANENFVVDPSGAMYGLSQILKVGVVEGGVTATDRQGVVASVGEGNWITLASFLRSGSLLPEGKGASEKTWGVVIYWEPGENDNLWNLNNGKTLSSGDVLSIDLGVKLVAAQEQYESDSFGIDYDGTAKTEIFPEFVGGTATVTVALDAENRTTEEVTLRVGDAVAVIPAGVLVEAGNDQLTLSVDVMNSSKANVQLGEGQESRSLDVHVGGMKNSKRKLLNSFLALLLCISMLVGTTFAWFTDSVVTGINTIAAGNLDVELYHSNAAVSNEQVDSSTKLFMDLQGNSILWEPGVVSYENLRIVNEGDLALAYQLAINTANENFVVDPSGAMYGLSQILKVGVVEDGVTATDRQGVVASVGEGNWITLASFLRNGSLLPEGKGASEKTWGIVIYWEPGENDNLWNLNNGKTLSSGDVLSIDLGVKLVATQEQYESDSFGNDYDATAKTVEFPAFVGGSTSATVVPDDQNRTTEAVTMVIGDVMVVVPAGVQLKAGVSQLTLSVGEMNNTGSNVQLGADEIMRSLDVHIDGVAEDNTTPIVVTLTEVAPTGLNMGNYQLYHVENGNTVEMTLVEQTADFSAHNQFKYDPSTGTVILYMATFSEVAMVAEEPKWEGGVDHSWYTNAVSQLAEEKATDYIIANADQLWSFSQIVGGMAKNKDGNFLITYKDSDGDEHHNDNFSGKTVKLISNINLGDKEDASNNLFYPIGYYNDKASYDKQDGVSTAANVTSFRGTFDGNGHTIANFYQNTWQMWGNYDGNNYKAGMGLFGYVNGGTVKNLTVDHFSSDGEFTPTGVIAAYAAGNATFENIAITNCNPRVYNTGNGGIIGIAGNTSGGDNITLKNITVNSSNKITALWGSWDVACGGLAGMFRGNENGNTISFKNCHVAAQIDVFNDVCANYQYYAYRYSGMMIGSVRNNVTQNGYSYPNTAGISAEKCTVHYETWNDYYYCELVANTKASYTHDYQFSRLERVAKVDGNSVTYLDGSEETITGTRNFVVVSGDHATENATCYHFVKGEIWEHADAGKETVGGVEIDVEDHAHIYLPFRQLFTGYGWGVTSKWLDAFGGVGVTERDTTDMIDKFEKNAALSGNFLYRVGNKNAFPIGKLFQETGKDAVVDSGVYVSLLP